MCDIELLCFWQNQFVTELKLNRTSLINLTSQGNTQPLPIDSTIYPLSKPMLPYSVSNDSTYDTTYTNASPTQQPNRERRGTRPFHLQLQVLSESMRRVQLALQGAHLALLCLQLQRDAFRGAGLVLCHLLHPLELSLQELQLPANLVMLGEKAGGRQGWLNWGTILCCKGQAKTILEHGYRLEAIGSWCMPTFYWHTYQSLLLRTMYECTDKHVQTV